MPNRAFRLSALAGSLFLACASQATPTGLFLMPIADILKHREAFAFAGLLGYERNVSKGHDYFNAATVGLYNKVEVGYDSDFMGSISGNVKLQLFEGKGTALSVGVVNWRGDAVDPYIVGRYDGKGYRLHGGVWRTGGTGRLMLGTDFPVAEGLTGSLEFLSGPGSQGWAGLFYAIPGIPGLGVQVAAGISSDHSAGIQHSALLFYSFKL